MECTGGNQITSPKRVLDLTPTLVMDEFNPFIKSSTTLRSPTKNVKNSNSDVQTATMATEKALDINPDSDNGTSSSSVFRPAVQTGIDRYVLVTKRKRSPRAAPMSNDIKKVRQEPIVLQNRFSQLDQSDPTEPRATNKEKPPPIYLREIPSSSLIEELKQASDGDFIISQVKRGLIVETKIQVSSIKSYRGITKYLELKSKYFYTYQLKSAKGLNVVIKGIESSVAPSEVAEALEYEGYKVKNCSNIINARKIPQPMFRVELDYTIPHKAKEIYKLKKLLWRRVVVEEPHKKATLVQCFNCQEFGHTKAYCRLPSVCVICSGFHEAKDCKLEKNNSVARKCSNCKENHTANYKGCPVYIALNKKKRTAQRNEQINLNERYRVNANADSAKVITGKSYADVLKPPSQGTFLKDENNESNSTLTKLMQMMETFMQTMQNNMNMLMQNFGTIVQLLAKSRND